MKNLSDQEIADIGRRVLRAEGEALISAADRIRSPFVSCVRATLSIKGKVVVSGLGKSGHVARKVAATLASTGTSACFLHPTEALHGDIGMLSKNDILVAIAFGGETKEVVSVSKFARRIGVPVIVITGRKDSTLAKLADHLIDASVEREACPLNLVPSASSTLSLALGDALALSLMEARGFNQDNFAELHPHGSLGSKLSCVGDHLRPYDRGDLLHPEDSFFQVLSAVTRNNFGIAPVVDEDNKLLGCVTDGDLRRAVLRLESSVFKHCALDLMSKSPKFTESFALAVDAIRIMEENGVTALFVVREEVPIGVVRLHDLLRDNVI